MKGDSMNLFAVFFATLFVLINLVFVTDGAIYAQNKCFGSYDPMGTHCRTMTRFDQFESRSPGFFLGEQMYHVKTWLSTSAEEK
jgi:hypothetical protein